MATAKVALRSAWILLPLLNGTVLAPVLAGQATAQPDSARAQIRSVLRAFYFNLENKNWDALSAYVLSPKLLERRGASGDAQIVARDRSRGRGSSHAVGSAPVSCSSSDSTAVEAGTVAIDGDWAEVSVATVAPMDTLLERLVGRWTMAGTVRGKPVTYNLDGSRVLQGRFVELKRWRLFAEYQVRRR